MTFDLQWKESMVELLDQLELWDPESSDLAREALEAAGDVDRFQQYATLYIRYLQIFRRLEESYDQTVHPQKRMDLKKTLEAVMGRVLEVKETLIGLKGGVNFINLDDVLVDLKLAPDVLEVPVPKFFIEDQAHLLEEREKYLDVLLKEAGIVSKPTTAGASDTMTLESAIRVVQLNERGRQGRSRAKFMKEIRAGEEREKRLLAAGEDAIEPEKMALLAQRCWRGYISRKQTRAMRAEELVFIGMAPPPDKPPEEDPKLKEQEVKARRKLIQAQHEQEYRDDLVKQKDVVYMAEGPDMKEEMMDQLRDWYIKYRERQGEFPQFPPEEEEEPTAEELAAQAAAAAGGGKDAKGGKDAGKKGKGGEEVEAPPPPPAYFVDALQDTFQEWTDKWQHRDDTNNFAQKHDVHLVKQMVRPEVETRVRDEVNALIEKELNNLKEAYDRDMKAKKAKGAKKGKKGKGKKGARACPFFSPATPSQPLPAAACRCLPPSLPHPCLPTSHPSPHLLPTSS